MFLYRVSESIMSLNLAHNCRELRGTSPNTHTHTHTVTHTHTHTHKPTGNRNARALKIKEVWKKGV